ncbi:MAG: ABC transporter permease [Opitutaceae bacterium]
MLADLRLAFRQFAKSPGFVATALLTLALGIGVCTAMFSIVNGILLQPLPYAEPAQLVMMWEDRRGDGSSPNNVAGGVAKIWQEQTTTVEGVAVLNSTSANLTDHGRPLRLNGLQVSSNYLRVLRLSPARGRDFLPDEGESGRSDVVILSHAAWQTHFGGNADVVGQTIQLGSTARTVVGILPPSLSATLGLPSDFLVPFAYGTPGWVRAWDDHNLRAIGRLKSSATVTQLREELVAIADRIRPNFPAFKQKWGVALVPLHEQAVGDIRPQLLLLWGATACVLLIACANVAGLLLARAVGREREMAVRLALGASRWSIVRQLLTENTLLALAGGTLGLLLAWWSIDAFVAWAPAGLAAWPVGIDGLALAFALVLSACTGLIAGLAPAWRLARVPFDELKSGGRTSVAGAHTGVRGALIVGQIALSLILLVGAGLLLRSLMRMQTAPLGFEPARALAADLTLDPAAFRDPAQRISYLETILQRIAALPGVESAGLTTNLPLEGSLNNFVTATGQPDATRISASFNYIHGDYLQTLRIPLVQGRLFTEADNRANAPRVLVIGASLAAKLFPGENAVGQRARFFGQDFEIVGVAGDVRVYGVERENLPQIYLPEARAFPLDRRLVVRLADSTRPAAASAEGRKPGAVGSAPLPAAFAKTLEAAILSVAPNQPVSDVRTFDRILAQQAATRRLTLGLLGIFALVAVALAAVGLYGILAYSVDRRTREIGIRSALGASRQNIFLLVISGGLKLTLVGIAIGLVGGYFFTSFVSKFLYDTAVTDPLTLGGVTALLLAIALLACVLPARRAAKVDPMTALRAE